MKNINGSGESKDSLGKNLRHLRKHNGETLQELADSTFMKANALSQYEHGH